MGEIPQINYCLALGKVRHNGSCFLPPFKAVESGCRLLGGTCCDPDPWGRQQQFLPPPLETLSHPDDRLGVCLAQAVQGCISSAKIQLTSK